jgi:enoyl-[acyl-carrier protein] reductase I
MDDRTSKWAFILGGSGAFGLASAKALAKEGFNLILVFRERRSGMTQKEGSFRELESMCKVIRFNLNANEAENQEKILGELCEHADVAGNIRFVLHALADGNLHPRGYGNGHVALDAIIA